MYTNIINNIIELEKVETFIDIKPYYVSYIRNQRMLAM